MARGRPSSYKPEFINQANKLCALGATDIEMADFFNIAVSTLYKWKNEHPDFSEALKAGKDLADERVERSLYQKAIGYTFDSEKIFQFQGEVVRAKTREHAAPDTTACIFWLKNRRAKAWRDIQRHEHGEPGEFDAMDEGALRDEITREAEEAGVSLIADESATQH